MKCCAKIHHNSSVRIRRDGGDDCLRMRAILRFRRSVRSQSREHDRWKSRSLIVSVYGDREGNRSSGCCRNDVRSFYRVGGGVVLRDGEEWYSCHVGCCAVFFCGLNDRARCWDLWWLRALWLICSFRDLEELDSDRVRVFHRWLVRRCVVDRYRWYEQCHGVGRSFFPRFVGGFYRYCD